MATSTCHRLLRGLAFCTCLLLTLAASACGSGSRTVQGPDGPNGTEESASWMGDLPPLSDLPGVPNQGHSVSAATPYNLLNNAPVAQSAGVNWSAGSLTLIPDLNGGIAWAVFGISGFDPGIYPQSIAGDKGGPLYVGLSRYLDNRWEWRKITTPDPTPWTAPHGSTTGFVNTPTTATYIAVVKISAEDAFARTLTALTLTASDQLFAQPTAAIAVTSPRPTAQYAVSFDFSGTVPGDGNITTVEFTPDTGDAPIALTPGDLAAPYAYTYATPGSKTATLRVDDDLGGSDTAQVTFDVVDTFKELLVVYNSDIPESADLAAYYMNPDTGRGIDPAYVYPLALGAAVGPEIDRPTYVASMRDPIRAFLDADLAMKNSLKYILLFKGVPHRISGAEGFSGDLNDTTCSAVDSELCTLYADGLYPNQGCLWNAETFAEFDADGFYHARDVEQTTNFATNTFTVSDENNLNYQLSYLVGRITGYSYDDAKASIDRALAADTSGAGWVIFDHITSRDGLDSMVDPVFFNDTLPPIEPVTESGFDLLQTAGYSVFADTTAATLQASDIGGLLPPNVNNIIGYAGWGVNHGGDGYADGANYIWTPGTGLDWNYLPGACFSSYESFNGSASDATPDPSAAARRGQGQILDFIYDGGTVAIGNVFEPYTLGCADERVVFYRYLVKGDRWIEAAYKGMRLLSWQEIVVGDPLCRVKP